MKCLVCEHGPEHHSFKEKPSAIFQPADGPCNRCTCRKFQQGKRDLGGLGFIDSTGSKLSDEAKKTINEVSTCIRSMLGIDDASLLEMAYEHGAKLSAKYAKRRQEARPIADELWLRTRKLVEEGLFAKDEAEVKSILTETWIDVLSNTKRGAAK